MLRHPTQAKTGLEWGTQPSLPVKHGQYQHNSNQTGFGLLAFSSTHSASCAVQQPVRPLIWTALILSRPRSPSSGQALRDSISGSNPILTCIPRDVPFAARNFQFLDDKIPFGGRMHFPIQKEPILRNTQAARLHRQSGLSLSNGRCQKESHAPRSR